MGMYYVLQIDVHRLAPRPKWQLQTSDKLPNVLFPTDGVDAGCTRATLLWTPNFSRHLQSAQPIRSRWSDLVIGKDSATRMSQTVKIFGPRPSCRGVRGWMSETIMYITCLCQSFIWVMSYLKICWHWNHTNTCGQNNCNTLDMNQTTIKRRK